MSGVVYVIGNGTGAIKIGFSRKFAQRLGQIKIGFGGRDPEVIAVIPADRWFEKFLHKKFLHRHVSGEWFSDCREIRDAVVSVQSRGTAALGYVAAPKPAAGANKDEHFIERCAWLLEIILKNSPWDREIGIEGKLKQIAKTHGLSKGLLRSLHFERSPKSIAAHQYQGMIVAASDALDAAQEALMRQRHLVNALAVAENSAAVTADDEPITDDTDPKVWITNRINRQFLSQLKLARTAGIARRAAELAGEEK